DIVGPAAFAGANRIGSNVNQAIDGYSFVLQPVGQVPGPIAAEAEAHDNELGVWVGCFEFADLVKVRPGGGHLAEVCRETQRPDIGAEPVQIRSAKGVAAIDKERVNPVAVLLGQSRTLGGRRCIYRVKRMQETQAGPRGHWSSGSNRACRGRIFRMSILR